MRWIGMRHIAAATALAISAPGLSPVLAEPLRGASGEVVARWQVADARDGVVVDGGHFYTLGQGRIGKHDKHTGREVAHWTANVELPLRHFTGGTVHEGRLYLAHSSHPQLPVASSIEIFDTRTMRHVASHSFGAGDGQVNWIDRHDNHWWVCRAYYDRLPEIDPDRGSIYTQIIKLDDAMRPLEAWLVDPALVAARLAPDSISGGGFGPDGRLYVTGARTPEIYALEFPRAGSTMIWRGTVPLAIEGQHFSWDDGEAGVIYGVVPSSSHVVVSRVSAASPSAHP